MATTKFYLDSRSGNAPYPLKLTVTHERKSVHLSLGIKLNQEQWDGTKVVKHPRAQMLNNQLAARKAEIDCKLYDWLREGRLKGKAVKDVKVMLECEERGETVLRGRVEEYIEKTMNRKSKGTRDTYVATLNKLRAYAPDFNSLTFDDITIDWLEDFDAWLSTSMPSPNSRGIYHRNIRAVFNVALDDGVTTNYPFRKFKIKRIETSKRSLSIDELRVLLSWEIEDFKAKYRDIFLLMILLRGINLVDLCSLKFENVNNGRIEYYRAKTHKLYSIKIEPEAQEILNRYKGNNFLIDICDRYANYKDFKSRMNKELKKIGVIKIGKHGKKVITPLFPKLSTYWARHTYASIAYNECGISMDIISDLLGHSNGMAVTNIYIRRNEKIADEAARRIIDKILYDK